MEKLKIEVLGWIEKGTGRHLSNTCYSRFGIAPTVMASLGIKQPGIFIVVEDKNGSSSVVQKFRSSEVQKFRSSEVQKFRRLYRFQTISQYPFAA